MISKRDLLDAIAECERSPQNYRDCQKLATFYTLYDHLYPSGQTVDRVEETTVGLCGDSEFLKAIEGADAKKAWTTIDELMSTIKAMQPNLYQGVLAKIIG